jgi:hypothetical protein
MLGREVLAAPLGVEEVKVVQVKISLAAVAHGQPSPLSLLSVPFSAVSIAHCNDRSRSCSARQGALFRQPNRRGVVSRGAIRNPTFRRAKRHRLADLLAAVVDAEPAVHAVLGLVRVPQPIDLIGLKVRDVDPPRAPGA